MLHIMLPTSGYDSAAAGSGARLSVTLLCTSAACRNGVVNNGFLLAAYDSYGKAVGAFESLPGGAAPRAQRHAPLRSLAPGFVRPGRP